ncbi:MAG: translation elongation factor Tu [Watsoniomyces obsoletus]|nr:MAG: translation elongation factor Tu [Watsoniomyces obsoletus]
MSWIRKLSRQSLFFSGGFAALHLFSQHVYTIRGAGGPSMLPTIHVRDDFLIISRRHVRGRDIRVGDVVSYWHPVEAHVSVVKRVIGMPGDFVLRDTPGSDSDMMIQIPEGHIWVVGDSLSASLDSRIHGPIPLALVRGKVLYRLRLTEPHFSRIENNLRPVKDEDA